MQNWNWRNGPICSGQKRINNFYFSLLLCGPTSTAVGSVTAAESLKEFARPNIVFIMTDNHSYQTLSAYDRRFIKKPELDRIA
jgi:hypothetical protein